MNASLLREYFKVAEFSRLRCCVLIFDVVPRSRSSGGERPPHTRKVTGSIPVGTTNIAAVHTLFSRPQRGVRAQYVPNMAPTERVVPAAGDSRRGRRWSRSGGLDGAGASDRPAT